jgi:AcrR family transcriptional regulator
MTEGHRETRDRILDTAEELFALEGFEAVSLRRIIGEAGVNLAAVHYYFGSKEGLVESLLERLVVPINGERANRLEQFRRGDGNGALTLEQVVRSFVEPVYEYRGERGRDGKFVSKLVGRFMTEYGEEMWKRMARIFEPTARLFLEEMRRLSPSTDESQLFMGLHFMAGTMAHTVGASDLLEKDPCGVMGGGRSSQQVIDDLITYIVGGLGALIGYEDRK